MTRERAAGYLAFGLALVLLLRIGFGGFAAGTYFSQDGFVWLCFAKFYATPHELLFRNTLAGQFFRPVGQYWWVAMHALAGGSVQPYQFTYLTVHLVNAALASWLGIRVAGRGVGRIILVLYALNPIFVAPVSNHFHYNFDTLGSAFALASLLLLTGACRAERRSCGLLSLAAALGAYFCKETYFTLPALALLVGGIALPGAGWSPAEARRHAGWMAGHALVCAAAWCWRWSVIGRFGGYGLAQMSTPAELFHHAAERAGTLAGFAGWSLAPACQRWQGDEVLPLLGSTVLLVWLTWTCRKASIGPGALWCWSWIVVAWLPSTIMTTYAAVSFYPALFGSVLLLALAMRRWPAAPALGLVLGLYYALHGWAYFHDRAPRIAELVRQNAALRARFPVGEWTKPDNRRVLLENCDPDLFPDPSIKYLAPPGTSMSGTIFFNMSAPVNWAQTDAVDPGDIRPLVVSGMFQDRFMSMPPYRAYPLELDSDAYVESVGLSGVTILSWDGVQFHETTQQPAQPGANR